MHGISSNDVFTAGPASGDGRPEHAGSTSNKHILRKDGMVIIGFWFMASNCAEPMAMRTVSVPAVRTNRATTEWTPGEYVL
jgi:hypothetical protein